MLFIGTHVNKHNLTFSLTFSLTFLAVGQRFELNLIAKKKAFRQVKSSLQVINLPSALPLMKPLDLVILPSLDNVQG